MTIFNSGKIYRGVRRLNRCEVTVNNQPLYHVVLHSHTGFEWGYNGSGPSDLALSILANYFDEQPTPNQLYTGDCQCWHYHQSFKRDFISKLPSDQWVILGREIKRWLKEQR